jgi:hypothetical protein
LIFKDAEVEIEELDAVWSWSLIDADVLFLEDASMFDDGWTSVDGLKAFCCCKGALSPPNGRLFVDKVDLSFFADFNPDAPY